MRSEIKEAIRRLHSDDYHRIVSTERAIQKVKRRQLVRRLPALTTLVKGRTAAVATALVAGVIVLVFLGGGIHYFNAFAAATNEMERTRSLVDSEIKRRTNLIPNLAVVAAEYSAHEVILYRYVSEVRTLLGNHKTDRALASFPAFDKLTGALLAVAEQYPDLKASRSFEQLMKDWTETENRVAEARAAYIQAVRNYNMLWTRFPSDVYGFLFGMRRQAPYVYEESAAPALDIKEFYSTYFASRVGHMPSGPFSAQVAGPDESSSVAVGDAPNAAAGPVAAARQ